MFSNIDDFLDYIEKDNIAMVDFKFIDLPGRWHHITVPASSCDRRLIITGIPFDSSSIPGFRGVSGGDMSLIPDIATGFIDPFTESPTLSFICNICEADTKENISGDPRGVAIRAERYLKSKYGADSHWLPEIEFYLFEYADYATSRNFAYFEFISEETSPGESGFYNRQNSGYHAIPPMDSGMDVRSAMVLTLENAGIKVRYHHHETGPCGQNEIEIMPAPLVKAADAVILAKYIIRLVAGQYGFVATFMPKPLFDEPGSGMHFHQFLLKNGTSLFWDSEAKYSHLSNEAHSYIAGLLEHAPSLVGITNPTTNSFKRLVSGFEAPTKRFYGLANRCAAIRVPKYDDTPELKRIEFRPPDGSCNPYIAVAAQLLAGLDGIDRKLDPTAMNFGPYDENIGEWSVSKRRRLKDIPSSLDCALDALEKDNDYLTKDGVFDIGMINRHIEFARSSSGDVARYPTAREMELYFDL
ncbi:type I glutamate--ammonia ligase [bacterium]|nr:MAG: type I glutamate--ammonia ligase [bacterium]